MKRLASALAIKAYHESGQNRYKSGIILNLTPSYPRRDSNNPEDVRAGKIADAFFQSLHFFDPVLDPAVKGIFPEELGENRLKRIRQWYLRMQASDLDIIKNTYCRFVGGQTIIIPTADQSETKSLSDSAAEPHARKLF